MNSYLSFQVQDTLFGLDIRNVLEILPHQSLQKVPRSPEFLAGLLNVRGEAFQVFDPAVTLHGKASDRGKSSCIILLSSPRMGLLVDRVHDVLDIEPGNIQKTDPADYVDGVALKQGSTILLIRPERLGFDV
ncbi:MAG: purine-binding chemotaxis protein CheW [Spirochaetales bacterium]|nr:purine-binding chemotaxis protein CheW [Spirochaetales bacterium]